LLNALPKSKRADAAVAAAALLGLAAAQAQLNIWDQCGGQGGNCKQVGACVDGPYSNKTCPSGTSCLKQSNWYYQCLPTDGYTCIPANRNVLGGQQGGKMWDQCGGQGGNCGSYICQDAPFANFGCPSGG
jgi:hypothetical protein